jgi:hypothetical protein
MSTNRRDFIRHALALAAASALPVPLAACDQPREDDPAAGAGADTATAAMGRDPEYPPGTVEDARRLAEWVSTLRREGHGSGGEEMGESAVRVGELAIGTPYEPFTLEAYIRAGDSPMRSEPLTLHLDRFDCVSLVESCLAIARIARAGAPAANAPTTQLWDAFAGEMERMRYRAGVREGYTSRLHYFSEWLADNERRGLVRDIGRELGGRPDERPLRFMSSNPDSYPALASQEMRAEIAEIERGLDDSPRWVVPTNDIAGVQDRIVTGDILAFATTIEGLDVTHAAFAYRDEGGVLRVLHAPLSGGVVEITDSTVPQYVAAIRRSTGILVARPLQG